MKKYHIILLLFLGVVFTPMSAFACGIDAVKHSCKTETSSKKKIKRDHSCCGKKSDKDKGCNGCCGHSKCKCSSAGQTSVSLPCFILTYQKNNFNFSSVEKVKFPNSYSPVSDGFYSLWLIPKIS